MSKNNMIVIKKVNFLWSGNKGRSFFIMLGYARRQKLSFLIERSYSV